MNREDLVRAGRALGALTDGELLDALAEAVHLWTTREAASVAAALAATTGASEAMLRFGLDRMGRAHGRIALEGWLRDARTEAGVEGIAVPRGPSVIAQVLAGNVAALALPATLEALLARSAVVLKPASGDPFTADTFRTALEETHPVLGAAVAVEAWRGGDLEREREVLGEADFVVATGGAEAVAALSARSESGFLGYGPRISIGVVRGGDAPRDRSWFEEVVREVVLWDQAGCLSPRVIVVTEPAAAFAREIAAAMRNLESRWPARPREAGEAAEVHAYRARHEMEEDPGTGLLASSDTTWTVVWDSRRDLVPGPPCRVLRIVGSEDLSWIEEAVAASSVPVQGVGLDGFLHGEEADFRERMLRRGVGRVAPLTAIQDPPAGWRADGRSGLAELLRAGSDSKRSD